MQNAAWWIVTIPKEDWVPSLPRGVKYIKGQLEKGEETGYLHWQAVVCLIKKQRLSGAKKLFPNSSHLEPTRSAAANEYVWKDETSQGERFEFGEKPVQRNNAKDWDAIWDSAKKGDIMSIPADVRLRCYSTLKKIEKDYMVPEAMERQVTVFIGPTNVGKSRKAWELAGLDAYPKDPNTKFWDGYNGQENVVIDEFRGRIDISHVLRWFDRYPVCVENKGGGVVLRAKRIYITSNLPVTQWYKELDDSTFAALLRRLKIIVMNKRDSSA